MTNGLFIRSYPTPGVKVIPMAFGASIYSNIKIYLVPIIATAWFAVILHTIDPSPRWALLGIVFSISILFLLASLVRKFSLEIRIDGVSYTSPINGTNFIAFSEISSVVLFDYRLLSSEVVERKNMKFFPMIITPNVKTGKSPMKLPLGLFPISAERELVRIFNPEEWESGT